MNNQTEKLTPEQVQRIRQNINKVKALIESYDVKSATPEKQREVFEAYYGLGYIEGLIDLADLGILVITANPDMPLDTSQESEK